MKYDDIDDKCIHRSVDTTMCTFMVDFIRKLKTGLCMRDMMNAVLEHLGVLQVSYMILFVFYYCVCYLDSGSERYQ